MIVNNKKITQPMTEAEPPAIIGDSDELQWKILATLQEMLQVQKDTYALFRKLSDKGAKT